MQEVILFYGHEVTEKLSSNCLSQMYPSPFPVADVMYKTCEHWMHATKAELFGDLAMRDAILSAASPVVAMRLGRKVRNFDADTWDRWKYRVVFDGNMYKFLYNKDLQAYLISTGSALLAEASPHDKVWGIGLSKYDPLAKHPDKWQGQNLLGKALMDIRRRCGS